MHAGLFVREMVRPGVYSVVWEWRLSSSSACLFVLLILLSISISTPSINTTVFPNPEIVCVVL